MAGDGLQVSKISSFKIHEDYSVKGTIENDIAMVSLEDPLDFDDPEVQPMSSWKPTEPIQANTYCLTIGCSQLRPSSNKYYASQIVDGQVVSDESCRNVYEKGGISIGPGMICASKPCSNIRNKPCRGDSGSPLVCPDSLGRLKMVGLVSFGLTDCSRNPIIVYTRISHYQDWISEQIENKK